MEEKKAQINKGGRPTKTIKRETKMGFNASATERIIIQEKAKRSGLRLADYLRDIALKGKPRAKLTPEELQLYRDLTGIANNLNQLTKEAHLQRLAVLVPKVMKVLDEASKTMKKIRDDNQD